MDEKRIYISGGINWNWYLGGTFNDTDKTVTIHFDERWHKYENRGSNAPEVTQPGSYRLLEDESRMVYGVQIETIQNGKFVRTEYLVLNPQKMFSYQDFDMLKGSK